jgi:type VI secretion system protein ImpG
LFNRYYQQELASLKELGAEFSRAHPTLAPMLSGPAADPDVERLLEGVAFLTGLLRQRLDDEFPEIVHDLMHLIWPHYLRPVPATVMVAFSPKPTLKQSARIPAGIHVASAPVDGTSCLFRTATDLEIHPLVLEDASFAQPPGRPPTIRLAFRLGGMTLSGWRPETLRLFLADDYAAATDIYFLLRRCLRRIVVTPAEGGSAAVLPPECLRETGFEAGEALIPYPSHAFPGYRTLQEYFATPERFLFVDLVGWDRWRDRGEGTRFEVAFELESLPVPPPRIRKESVLLFVSPAVNIFPHAADPVLLDHRSTHHFVRPSGGNPEHYRIYSVDRVIGHVQGSAEERRYVPFELFNPDPRKASVYHVSRRESPVRPGADAYLSVAYPSGGAPPVPETLSIQLTCTNGSLPEGLRAGDIAHPTGSSPEYVEFRNIRPPSAEIPPPLGKNLLWRLLSHLSLNHLSLARAENLRALLDLYVFPDGRDRAAVLANRRRIEGIESIETRPADRIVSGAAMRGQEIRMRLSREHFASQGDMFLFGCVLDRFLGSYAAINHFTTLTVQETARGEVFRWPARLGDHPLI